MGSNEVAVSVSTVNTAVTALNFEGVGGASSSSAITGLNTALQILSGWVQEKPPIAATAVSAYQTAVSAMIPAEICMANRAEQAADVAINPLVLGALTPAIVALDAEYFGEHWPHNASTGAAYGAALSALVAALAVPPPLSPWGTSPAGPAAAAAAATQAAGQTAAAQAVEQSAQAAVDGVGPAEAAGPVSQAISMTAQPLQTALDTTQPVMGMFRTPSRAIQDFAGLPQSMSSSLNGMLGVGAAELPVAMLADTGQAAAVPGSGAVGAGATSLPGGAGAGARLSGIPGTGLTTYIRPATTFAAENSGRPIALKTVEPPAEFRGPTTAGISGALPVSPGQPGVHSQMRNQHKEPLVHARIVTGTGKPV